MAAPSRAPYAQCPHCGEFFELNPQSVGLASTPSCVAEAAPATHSVPAATAPARAAATTPSASLALEESEPPRRRAVSPLRRRGSATERWRNSLPVRLWKRYLPPVRLVWIFLALIAWNAGGFLSRSVAWPLVFLPLVAVAVDLGLQGTRFPRLRFPDAAIANGLFLSVILWPTTVSVELAAVAAATVGVRHLLRVGGHPVFNPAAVGVTLAAVVFALPQPWHVGFTLGDTVLVAALGLILWSRARHTWRLWAVYFLSNIVATLLLADYLGGAAVLPLVVQTSVLGVAPVFYGFFMVTEPRTAPSARRAMVVYGGLVGVTAAVFPILFAQDATVSALGVLAPYLALFLGNAVTVAWPSSRGARRAAPTRPSGTISSRTNRAAVDA